MVSMDQFFQIFFAGLSAIGAIVSGFYAYKTWLHTIGSKEAEAKADEAHKAALAMRDAAERSAKAAEEQANQAKLARKAAEERVRQAEKSLEQMQQIVAEQQSQSQSQSEIAANLYRPIFELTHDGGTWFKLRNTTKNSIKIIEVANANKFTICDFEELPRVLKPNEEISIILDCKGGVTNLELRIDGQDDSVFIPLRFSHPLTLVMPRDN